METILLVDDNAEVLDITRELLEGQGYEKVLEVLTVKPRSHFDRPSDSWKNV